MTSHDNMATEDSLLTPTLNSINDTYDTIADDLKPGDILFFAVQTLVTTLIMVLNGSVIAIMVQQRVHQKDHSSKFLMSLLISSGMGGCSALIFSLQMFTPHNFWICVILYNDVAVVTFIMWMNLLFVNLDQLMKIEYPLRYPSLVTGKIVKICLAFSWLFPMAMQLIMFFSDETNSFYCKFDSLDKVRVTVSYYMYMILVGYVVPLFLIGSVQCRIIYNARKQRRVACNHQRCKFHAVVDRTWPSVLTASIIFGTALLSSSPLYIFLMESLINPDKKANVYRHFDILMMFMYLKFLINPIIYAARIPEVGKVVCCCCWRGILRKTTRKRNNANETNAQ